MNKLPGATPLGLRIRRQNETHNLTTIFENERLQTSTPRAGVKCKLEQLTRENGHLRLEIQFYRACFTYDQRFRREVITIAQELLLAYYQEALYPEGAIEHCLELTVQLRNAVQQVLDEQNQAEESWLGFWGAEQTPTESSHFGGN